MNLNEITDIELLREELKSMMAKCIKSYSKDGFKFKKGEYYHTFNNYGEVYCLTSNYNSNTCKIISIPYYKAEKYFKKTGGFKEW